MGFLKYMNGLKVFKVCESIETERTRLTTVRKKPNKEEFSLINLIAKEYLDKETSSKELSFELTV